MPHYQQLWFTFLLLDSIWLANIYEILNRFNHFQWADRLCRLVHFKHTKKHHYQDAGSAISLVQCPVSHDYSLVLRKKKTNFEDKSSTCTISNNCKPESVTS